MEAVGLGIWGKGKVGGGDWWEVSGEAVAGMYLLTEK